jgi:hypothetical protein
MATKEHTVDELSALFDEIEVGKNLDVEKPSDYGTASTTGNLRPFADRCADVRAVMQTVVEPEPVTEDAPEIEPEPESEPVAVESAPIEAQSTPTPEPDEELDLASEPEPKQNETPMSDTINSRCVRLRVFLPVIQCLTSKTWIKKSSASR